MANFSAAKKKQVAKLKPKSNPAILMVGVYRLAWSHRRRRKGMFPSSLLDDEAVVEEEAVTRHMLQSNLEDCCKKELGLLKGGVCGVER